MLEMEPAELECPLPYRLPPLDRAPDPELRVSVAIPARNEADSIAAVVTALAAQTDGRGSPLARACYEVILFANDCDDETVERAREAAGHGGLVLLIAEDRLPNGHSNVGTARRAAMDVAAQRLCAVGRSSGIVATTDADTIVHPNWVVETERALERADAVGGRIIIDPRALRAMPTSLGCALSAEARYRFAVARAESARDPLPHDPWPRHGQQFAASLAVRADRYFEVGGLPALPCMEDLAFYDRLMRADARFVHSLRVRVSTSPRMDPRVEGGFGSNLARVRAIATTSASQAVEDPDLTLARIRSRAWLRRWKIEGRNCVPFDARRLVAQTFATSEDAIDLTLCTTSRFGEAFASIESSAERAGAFASKRVRIAHAIATLETALPLLSHERGLGLDRTPTA